MDERLALIQPTLTYDDFGEADIVIEAVFEGMALKKQVFAELDQVAKPGAILATNTSTLEHRRDRLGHLAAGDGHRHHFFSPANVMRLLEIVRGKATSKEVIATCMELAKKLGKVGVLVGNCRGFVGNRMFRPYRREAQFLVEEGAGVEAVDQALYDFGMAMGPLAIGDLAGLDVGWRIRKEYRAPGKARRPPALRRRSPVRDGPLRPEDRRRLVQVRRESQAHARSRSRSADRAMVPPKPASRSAKFPQKKSSSAASTPWSTKARASWKKAIALRAVDIDIIYLNGYGFPAYRGGPMWYADTVGLEESLRAHREFQRQHGELWDARAAAETAGRRRQERSPSSTGESSRDSAADWLA